MVEKTNTQNDPVEEQDDKNLDDEFKRIETEQKLKSNSLSVYNYDYDKFLKTVSSLLP